MIIVAIVLLVALLIMLTKFPALQSDNHSDAKQGSFSASLSRLARIRHWRWAVLAQFCYVGAQTACLELFDSLRCRRNSRYDCRLCR